MTVNMNGITVKELKEFLNKIPDKDSKGNNSEIWIDIGAGLSSPCVEICTLNESDVILTPSNFMDNEN